MIIIFRGYKNDMKDQDEKHNTLNLFYSNSIYACNINIVRVYIKIIYFYMILNK